MSDENASTSRETLPFRHRDYHDGKQLDSEPMGSPEADPGDGSPKRSRMAFLSDDGSMTSNRAHHSASVSFSHKRAGSTDVPDDYGSDAVSDPAADFSWSNTLKGRRQTRKIQQHPGSGTALSRPMSRAAAEIRAAKASPGGSESRLRYSVNSTEEFIGHDGGPSRLQQHIIRSSPVSNDERFPLTLSARQDEMGSLSRASGESTEGLGDGQESAGHLSNDQKSAGGVFAVAGGTASYAILPQPETHPITEEQLINEIRGIYAGLVMVEKKCMEIDRQQSQSKAELSNQQWQALIALHRTLLQEHHDFFLASQHPSASPVLKRLSEKYAMPARMWRYGIHAFLELLRHRLPGSLEHMLTFIYLAYSMMTLLLETVPSFEETWIECLGDLSRYRMAVEETDFREREVWAGVARYWYNKAADRNPDVGRIQHHLAVLARPDIVQQLFYYTKSLVNVHSFAGTRESIFLLFNPLLKGGPRTVHRLPEMVTAFVAAHGYMFTRDASDTFMGTCAEFLSFLEQYIGRTGPAFKMQGVYIVSCNFASVLEYGATNALLPTEFLQGPAHPASMEDIYIASHRHWTHVRELKTIEADFLASRDSKTLSQLIFYGSCLSFQTFSVILDQVGDTNIYPAFHVSLAFLWCLSRTSNSIKHVELVVPWKQVAAFLNTLIREFTDFTLIEGSEFPISDEEKWLPEDFLVRGQIWSQNLYPSGFFNDAPTADDGRNTEPPSRDLSRMHRCLWLGVRLAMFNRWITYDASSRNFSATDFASELDTLAQQHHPFYGKGVPKRPITDVEMHDT
ncbi:hypothetical protein ARAM_000595 [Aspergillus rambellii]|uniref:DNA/RNA-binding domain-containing protein n=1 Tax=Aspergillus rambellii TaxID=308745 RepID=A0A0F8XFX7_9EURO|nr:hypothetical protein ARAM_000595 [Aspergillus rambellii]